MKKTLKRMPTDRDCFQQVSIYNLHRWNNFDAAI